MRNRDSKLQDDQITSYLSTVNSKDTHDMRMRRIVNLGKSKKRQDAVTRQEIIEQLNEIRAFVGMPLIES